MYIADTWNHRIRKVAVATTTTTTITITTVAGGDLVNGDGGDATSAILTDTLGIAIDSLGM